MALESRRDAPDEQKYWEEQIKLAQDDRQEWDKEGKSVQERYKRKPKDRQGVKSFNILYSNTEVLKGALFARMAKPDVRRRFKDKDPKGRIAAEVIERGVIYVNDVGEPEAAIKAALEDYLLPGRGIVRVCYEATTSTHPETGAAYVSSQELWDEYVSWDDWLHEPVKLWAKLTWMAFRRRMSRDDLHKNFDKSLGAEEVNKIPLSWEPKTKGKSKVDESVKKAEVWEIWDKNTKTRIWFVSGFNKILRTDPDPLGLEDFWPMPEPVQATTTTETYIPQPEFLSYKDQADGLDEIEGRIDKLTRALKRRGAYNAKFPELKRLGKLGDNEFIPVEKWEELKQGGGLKNAYEVEDIAPIATILDQLHAQRELRIQSIYEIMGIADIMRGSTDPNETLGAQQLKAQFGGNRLKRRQDDVQRWIKGMTRIKAEIIAEHFEPQKLSEITGFPWVPNAQPGPDGQEMMIDPNTMQPVPVPPEAITPSILKILRTDRLRCYRIDIETDSTIYEDAEAEKQARVELLTALSQFVTSWVPVIQAKPELLPLAFELMMFGVRGFKTGRQVEEALEQAKMQLEEAAKQAAARPQQPPVDPEAEAKAAAIQQDAQRKDAQAQADQAFKEKQHADHMQLERDRMLQADAHKKAELDTQERIAKDNNRLERDRYEETEQDATGKKKTRKGVARDTRPQEEADAQRDNAIMSQFAQAIQLFAEAVAKMDRPRQVIPQWDPRTGRIAGALSVPQSEGPMQ